ncbi:MAG: hypothetical protein QNJ91_05010 [Gammaproteobacteria bacterium]|nr:hypothetical protein [Gammaproteobacteria bacterium]
MATDITARGSSTVRVASGRRRVASTRQRRPLQPEAVELLLLLQLELPLQIETLQMRRHGPRWQGPATQVQLLQLLLLSLLQCALRVTLLPTELALLALSGQALARCQVARQPLDAVELLRAGPIRLLQLADIARRRHCAERCRQQHADAGQCRAPAAPRRRAARMRREWPVGAAVGVQGSGRRSCRLSRHLQYSCCLLRRSAPVFGAVARRGSATGAGNAVRCRRRPANRLVPTPVVAVTSPFEHA